MAAVIIFFVAHWHLSLAAQSIFHHRYAAHEMFPLSEGAVKRFYIFSWLTMGSSYLSPYVYGLLHRLHHRFTDKEGDPHPADLFHGPLGLFKMMWMTKNIYVSISEGRYPDVEKVSNKNLPDWRSFENFAHSWLSRLVWVGVYIGIYVMLASPWFLYPLLLIHVAMGPVHGVIINWFAHKYGSSPYKTGDSSTNLNVLVADIVVPGEGFHNNHHGDQTNPNFARRRFEFDAYYWVMRLLGLKMYRKNL